MMVATAAQMKELDRQAIEEYGIPSLDLMERAALGVAGAVWSLVGREDEDDGVIGGADGPIAVLVGGPDREEARREQERLQNLANALAEEKAKSKAPWVGVLCGPGNNGGDGVAAARILMGMGCRVRAFLVGDRSKMTPDERAMEEKLKEAGGALEAYLPLDREQSFWLAQCDCLVDALFGVGLSRPVEGDFLYAVREMQDRPHFRRVVSCDIPSGVHADTGEVLGPSPAPSPATTWGTGRNIRENCASGTLASQMNCCSVRRPGSASRWRRWRGPSPSPAGSPTATRGTTAGCFSWPGARVIPAHRCWPPLPPCAAGRGWSFWGCPGRSTPSWR